MCIEESSDTIFNMGCGGAYSACPPPMDYWQRKSAMDERVNTDFTLDEINEEEREVRSSVLAIDK